MHVAYKRHKDTGSNNPNNQWEIERKKSDNQKKTKKTKHREINNTTKKARERRQRTDSQTDAGRK